MSKKSRPAMAIVADAVAKDYGGLVALEPLSLEIAHGERVALVGHNGSGKTTFLKMAAGLLEPSDGSISVFGSPAGKEDARRRLSWLSDTPTFYDDLSVMEHLEFIAQLHGVEDWTAWAARLLEWLGIEHRADDLPTRFSRGLRQKAAIALAWIRPFDVLLVDEPFVGLDSAGKTALVELFDEASGTGASLVVATHELSFLQRVDRVIALRDGSVVFDGRPRDVDVEELVRPV